MGRELDITKKNFGLIHVYFLYTVFRATYRAVISKVICLLNCIEKNRGGGGVGELSVGRIQLAFNLEIAGGKKGYRYKKKRI